MSAAAEPRATVRLSEKEINWILAILDRPEHAREAQEHVAAMCALCAAASDLEDVRIAQVTFHPGVAA